MVFTNIANVKAACFEDEGERRERKREGQRERERGRGGEHSTNECPSGIACCERNPSICKPSSLHNHCEHEHGIKNLPFHRGSVSLLSSSVGISLLAFLIPSCRGRYSSITNYLNFHDVRNFDNILAMSHCSGVRRAQVHCPSSLRSPFLVSTTLARRSRFDAGCFKKGALWP